MSWRYIYFGLFVFWQLVAAATYAYAEDSPQAQQAQLQVLSTRLLNEIKGGISCSTDTLLLQAEVKRLVDKYEPKTDEPKK